MAYVLETLSTLLSGVLVFLITRQWRDLKEYRKKREIEELQREQAKEKEWADMRTAIQMLVLTQFAYEKEKVAKEGIFPSEDRIEYEGLLLAGEALGFDGRMHTYWEFCCKHPDEDGKIYGN